MMTMKDDLEHAMLQSNMFGLTVPEGLLCNESLSWNFPTIEVPFFHDLIKIEKEKGQITWSFIIPEEFEDSVSLRSSTVHTPEEGKYKARHEFVAETFGSESTDVPLSSLFEQKYDEFDKLTPDIIWQDIYGRHYVVEIGTTRSTTQRQAERVYNEKNFKYYFPLSERSDGRTIMFSPVIVTPDGVLSNVKLPNNVTNELLVRMRIACALEDKALEIGFSMTSSEEQTVAEANAEQILQEIRSIGSDKKPCMSRKHPNCANKGEKGSEPIVITDKFIEQATKYCDSKTVLKSFETATEIMMKRIIKGHNDDELLKDFYKSLPDFNDSRMDMKPIINMPFIIAQTTDPSNAVNKMRVSFGNAPEYMMAMWSEALSQVNDNWIDENPAKLKKEAIETDQVEIRKYEEERNKNKRKYHRVNLKKVLTRSVRLQLAKDGVMGKKHSGESEIKERRENQKLPFHISTEVTDIDDFLLNDKLLDDHCRGTSDHDYMISKLISRANEISRQNFDTSTILKKWMDTKLYRALDVMSEIAAELVISLKQNTKPDEFILKKLRSYNVYVLIKTTNSDSPLFYSIMLPEGGDDNILDNTCFRKMHKTLKTSISEFVSVRKDKLVNFLNAPSRLISLASFYSYLYSLNDVSPDDFKQNSEARRMLYLSLLISLENKAQTEEIVTTTRYMYMEIFKTKVSLSKPNPLKMLDKMPKLIRSRLSVWIINRIIGTFRLMQEDPPRRVAVDTKLNIEDGQDSLPGDQWEGLLNFFTGSQVNSASTIVQLIYLGYLKDKNEVGQKNTDWKLIEKIIEEEIEMNESRVDEYYGDSSPVQKPCKKGFRMDNVMFGCEVMESMLSSKMGSGWKKSITREICSNLARQLTHEIATLKATSIEDHDKVFRKCGQTDTEEIKRLKVIEVISSKLDKLRLNPMKYLKEFLEYIETTSGGVICDLFKKNQHGGLREIYVLTLESRIVQLYIETISRTICSHFQEETLTHPSNKLKMLDAHRIEAARTGNQSNSMYMNLFSSSDKTRWNQNLLMTALSVPLLHFTEDVFHNSIKRILNLWSNKHIRIPPSICNMLLRGVDLSSPAYRELKKQFEGKEDSNDIFYVQKPSQSPFVRMTSGMMQGILHYTSSLLHLTFLFACKKVILNMLKVMFGGEKYKFMMTSACSSDDSATALTVFFPPDSMNITKRDIEVTKICDLFLEVQTVWCEWFCMRESIKSTISMIDYVEYNSEFLFKNTIVVPIIKFVAASVNFTESSSFIQRSHENYNLISSLSGSGFPSYNTHYCQLAQAILHYKSIGISTSCVSNEYFKDIMIYPDVVHGFFLLDNYFLTGVMGFGFCRWLSIQFIPELAASAKLLNYSEMEVAPDGTVIDCLNMSHKNLSRWHKLVLRIYNKSIKVNVDSLNKSNQSGNDSSRNNTQEYLSYATSDPEILYSHPNTIEELHKKLICKSSTSGVAKSLSKGNPLIQAFSSSVYCLFTHCFSRTSVSMKNDRDTNIRKKEKIIKKYSLLSSLNERIKYANRYDEELKNENILDSLFPLSDRYKEALDIINMFQDHKRIPSVPLRMRKNILKIEPGTSRLPITLLQCVCSYWFGHKLKASNNVRKRCWENYKARFPWLSESMETTLLNSPFSSHIEMHSFISSISSKPRVYHKHGPTLDSPSLSGQLYFLIRKCTFPSSILSPQDRVVNFMGSSNVEELVTKLDLALLIPTSIERTQYVHNALLDIKLQRPNISDWESASPFMATVGMIALLRTNSASKKDILDFLHHKSLGMSIVFTKEQRRVTTQSGVEWRGTGECIIKGDGIKLLVELDENCIIKIHTQDVNKLRKNPGFLRKVFNLLSSVPPSWNSACPGEVMRFNGMAFCHSSQNGTPILHDPYLETTIPDYFDISVRIDKGSISINTDSRIRAPGIVTHFSKIRSLGSLDDRIDDGTIWRAWVNKRTYQVDKAYWFVKDIVSVLEKANKNSREYKRALEQKHWVQITLKKRCTYKSLSSAHTNYSDYSNDTKVEPEYELTDHDREAFNDFLMDFDDLGVLSELASDDIGVMSVIKNDGDEFNLFDDEDEIPDNELDKLMPISVFLNNYDHAENEDTVSVTQKSIDFYICSHPIWDELIKGINNVDPHFFQKVFGGTESNADPELSNLIMSIMDIKKRLVIPNLTQRFERLGRPSIPEEEINPDDYDDDQEV